MAPLLRVMPLTALLLVAAACDNGATGGGDDEDSSTPPPYALIARDARAAWAAETDPEADATGAVASSGWILVATTRDDRSAVIGLDRDDGVQWWEQDIGQGDAVLTVRADGAVEACSDDTAAVLDPTTGVHLRAEAECPDADTASPYDVEDSELVVYNDLEHSVEKYRIALRDPDAEVWALQRAVVTYSPSAHEVRLYR